MKELLNLLVKHNEKGNVQMVSLLFDKNSIVSINPSNQSKFVVRTNVETTKPFLVPTKLLKQALNIIDEPLFYFDEERNKLYCKGVNQEISFQVVPVTDDLMGQYKHDDIYNLGESIIELNQDLTALNIVRDYVSSNTGDQLHLIEIAVDKNDAKLYFRATDNIALIECSSELGGEVATFKKDNYRIYILPETVDLLIKLKQIEDADVFLFEDGIRMEGSNFEYIELNHYINFPDFNNVYNNFKVIKEVNSGVLPLKQLYDITKKMGTTYFDWLKDEVIVVNDVMEYRQPSLLPPHDCEVVNVLNKGLHFTNKLNPDIPITIKLGNDCSMIEYDFELGEDEFKQKFRVIAVNLKI